MRPKSRLTCEYIQYVSRAFVKQHFFCSLYDLDNDFICVTEETMNMFVGTQNINGCTFEEVNSCGFAGIGWKKEKTSASGLHYENTFKIAFRELRDILIIALIIHVTAFTCDLLAVDRNNRNAFAIISDQKIFR